MATKKLSDFISDQSPLIILILIIPFALWVRLFEVGSYYFNADETFNLAMYSHDNIIKMFADNLLRSTHTPMGDIFGFIVFHAVNWTGDGVLFRLIPLIPGMGVILLSAMLGNIIAGRSGAIFCCAVTAFGVSTITLSRDIRDYSLLMFFEMAAIINLLLYLKHGTRSYLAYYFILMFFGIFTNYTIGLSLAGIGMAVMFQKLHRCRWYPNKNEIHDMAFWILPNLAITTLVMGYFFLQKPYQFGAIDYSYGGYPKNAIQYINTIYNMIGFFVAGRTMTWLSIAGILFAVAGICRMIKEKKHTELMICILPLIINIITDCLRLYPFSFSRHCFFLLPFFLILGAYGFSWVTGAVSKRLPLLNSPNCIFASIIIFSAAISFHIKQHNFYHLPYRDYPYHDKKKYMGGGEEILGQFFANVGEDDIILVDGWMANYFVYRVGADNVKMITPYVFTVNYWGKPIFFRDYNVKYVAVLNGYAQVASLVIQAERYQQRGIKKIWFIDPGSSWGRPITQALYTKGPLAPLYPYMIDSYLSSIIKYFSIDMEGYKKYLNNGMATKKVSNKPK